MNIPRSIDSETETKQISEEILKNDFFLLCFFCDLSIFLNFYLGSVLSSCWCLLKYNTSNEKDINKMDHMFTRESFRFRNRQFNLAFNI